MCLFAAMFPYLPGQTKGLRQIDQNDLRAYMNFLASDELQGREAGTAANNIASVFLESNLRRMGIEPPYGNGSYLQHFNLKSTRIIKTSLKFSDAGGGRIFSTDSVVTLLGGYGIPETSGELVFAGYGYDNTGTDYNDTGDIDIKDKIVLVMTRNPAMADSSGVNAGYVFDEKTEAVKLLSLIMREPKAVLLVYDPKNSFSDPWESGLADYFNDTERTSLMEDQSEASLPGVYFITGMTADILLSPAGTSLKQFQEMIGSMKVPCSTAIPGIRVSIDAPAETREYTASNVIGMIEGSDPVLKNECIVYTAHFDHVGMASDSTIFNGADDNASGSAGLLEIAEAFRSLRKRPLRSVVFAWMNAEEKGLLGSEYYAGHPVIPTGRTILNINLDMIGRSITPADTGDYSGTPLDVTGPNEIQVYSGNVKSEFRKQMLRSAVKAGLSVLEMGEQMEFGSSDHQSFAEKGVPWLFFHTGIHADLHEPEDDASKIDFRKMEKAAKLAFLTGYRIANSGRK